MNIQFFNDISSLEELKKQYKKLAFKNHPDRGGNTETMQKINSEYDFLLKKIINNASNDDYSESKTWTSKEAHTEAEQRMKDALDKIINLEGLEIEIIGTWLWVSGDTKTHKEALKEAGLKWNGKLEKWLFVGSKSNGRGTMAMDQIREKHGSQVVKTKPVKKAIEKK